MSKKKAKKPRSEPFGRPTDYRPEYCQMLIDYFNRKPYETNSEGNLEALDFPSLAGFACTLEVSRDTLANWAKANKDFFCAYKRAKDYQENFLIVNSMKGLTNPAFSIFTAKNVLGWRDKVELSEDEETDLEFN